MINLIVNHKTGSEITPQVQILESVRDRGLKAFFKVVLSLCFRLNDEVANAAKRLSEVIKRHGLTMYNLPQDQQTSAMASLFKELEQSELVKAIEVTNTKILLDEAKKLVDREKVKKLLQPQTPSKPVVQGKSSPTLSNAVAAQASTKSGRTLSDEDSKREAAKLIRWDD